MVNAAQINGKFLMPDEKKISNLVRSLGKDAEKLVGGIQVYHETIVRAGGR